MRIRATYEGEQTPVKAQLRRAMACAADAIKHFELATRHRHVRAQPIERTRQHRIEYERRALAADAEQTTHDDAERDPGSAGVDTPAPVERDGAFADTVVFVMRLITVVERGVRAREIAIGL